MNRYNSSLDTNYSTCLPPEAYLRIIKSCGSDVIPKFKSSVYPSKDKKTNNKVIVKNINNDNQKLFF
jgi:hypothetical protein